MLRKTGSWQNLDLASGAGDFLLRRFAELVCVHGERDIQIAIAQDLDGRAQFPDQAGGAQQFGCHRFTRGKAIEHFHVHYGKFAVRWIVKAPLRDPAAQWHLAALKTGTPRIPLARFLSLVAFAGRPAELRTDAAAHAHLAMPRSARRLQIGKIHSHVVLNLTLPQPPDAGPSGSSRESPRYRGVRPLGSCGETPVRGSSAACPGDTQ